MRFSTGSILEEFTQDVQDYLKKQAASNVTAQSAQSSTEAQAAQSSTETQAAQSSTETQAAQSSTETQAAQSSTAQSLGTFDPDNMTPEQLHGTIT